MTGITTPHDAAFKTFLSHAEAARDFIEPHLPPSLIKIYKLETLRLESGSFIEDDLRPYLSDILCSLEITSGHNYVHVLVEHQSSPDKYMSLRLMCYAIAAMQYHLEAGNDTLSPVTPVLFYYDKQNPQQGSMNWLDHSEDSGTVL